MSKTARDIAESIKALKQGGQTEKVKKVEEIKTAKKNGGARPGAGRKPKEANLIARGIKQWVDEHINEQVEVRMVVNGRPIMMKKPRVVAALEKLYTLGMRNDGDADALNKWLDRALGKAVQPIAGDQDNPILLKIDF